MIPYAILSGKVFFSDNNFIDIRILDLSLDSFTFRLSKRHSGKEISRIHLQCLDFDKCTRNEVILVTGEDFTVSRSDFSEKEQINNYTSDSDSLQKTENTFFDAYRVLVKSPQSEEYTRKLTQEYLNYIQLKLAGDDAKLSEELVGYPAELDELYPESVEEWRESCFGEVIWEEFSEKFDRNSLKTNDDTPVKKPMEISLNLNTPALLESFLDMPCEEFLAYVEANYYLGKIPISGNDNNSAKLDISSLYIGNQFDYNLLPEKEVLSQVMKKAQSLQKEVVFQFPPMKEELLEAYKELLEKLRSYSTQTKPVEIVINDFGLLELLHENYPNQFHITLGILLNKRRKDVRLSYKKGLDSQINSLQQNSLNADFYQTILMEKYDVKKYSYEACEYPYQFAGDGHIFHLPYYQMNTGGLADQNQKQLNHNNNPTENADTYLFYPTHLHMIGKNNTLFGYDRKILTDKNYLETFLKQKPSRIVLEII